MEASIEQQELQKAPVEADHSAATSSQGEGIPELPDKHKRQASRVNYQEIGDRDEDFEAMLAAEERHYHAAKRQRMEAKGSTQVISSIDLLQDIVYSLHWFGIWLFGPFKSVNESI